MKTLPNSQATFLDETEFPLMLSPAGSRARTYQPQENRQEWARGPEAGCGPKSSDLLASYDRATSSWRTSQTCFLAQAKNEADGLAEYLETWPSAGMMRNGKTYQRQPWALPIAENASGLLPTPRKMLQQFYKTLKRKDPRGNLEEYLGEIGEVGIVNPAFTEMMMGFPVNWSKLETDSPVVEMPLSPKSPK